MLCVKARVLIDMRRSRSRCRRRRGCRLWNGQLDQPPIHTYVFVCLYYSHIYCPQKSHIEIYAKFFAFQFKYRSFLC